MIESDDDEEENEPVLKKSDRLSENDENSIVEPIRLSVIDDEELDFM